jgi:gamma-glutamylcyclotransferase (GGCT)/AIG2-like uncharacterized protein YtfP
MNDLYFAYGSNLDEDTWRSYCKKKGRSPECIASVGMAYLPDESLVFNFYSKGHAAVALDIEPRRGCRIAGWLFKPDTDGWMALDAKEGHPHCYRREAITVIDTDGNEHDATTYRIVTKWNAPFVAPSEAYLAACDRGRKRLELTDDELVSAAKGATQAPCRHVFVYGTLIAGQKNATSWSDLAVASVVEATVKGTLLDHGSYPGLKLSQGDEAVKGWLIEFNDVEEALDRFDRIEGFNGFGAASNLFRRTLLNTRLKDGTHRQAWGYVSCLEYGEKIDDGDWVNHVSRQEPLAL